MSNIELQVSSYRCRGIKSKNKKLFFSTRPRMAFKEGADKTKFWTDPSGRRRNPSAAEISFLDVRILDELAARALEGQRP